MSRPVGARGPAITPDLYRLRPRSPAPEGVPLRGGEDEHTVRCFAEDYADRRAALLARVVATPPPEHAAAVFHELARLEAGGPLHRGVFDAALDHVEARLDCADFVLAGILRLLIQRGDDPRVPAELVARAREVTLGFKYHPEEPGVDSLCTWTENHQILFASAALLAGERFPEATFRNTGETGREKASAARPRILRWLEMRFRTGFSEWLSNVYYDEDMTALANLVELSADEEIRRRSAMVLDLLLLDLALHGFDGVFASTHGRSYQHSKQRAAEEGTTDTGKLVFGTGSFARRENMAAVCLALSPRYRVPAVLKAIADDRGRPETLVRQRMGIRVADAARWGLDLSRPDDVFELLSLEAYFHPRTISRVMDLFDAWDWWANGFFRPLAARRGLLRALRRARGLPALARLFRHDLGRNLREEVNLVTYRTPDYQLSSALDWAPGRGGDQQHLWQATLGPDAVCFTTHPGSAGSGRTPDRWTGSGVLPRVAQWRNVAIALYRIPRRLALHLRERRLYTHAWLPRDRFDQMREEAGWIFARRGDGYLALRSEQPWRWEDDREVVAPGRRNAWVCELGRRADDGRFDEFVAGILSAALVFSGEGVRFDSPSRGLLELGWRGPFRAEGREVPMRDFPRYETPWGSAGFPMDELRMEHANQSLHLRWSDARREASDFLRG